ncbi:ParA family protein [Phytohabitans sp. ZYX-F-186]|uniref:ParA family protein n=1 Tax=Phytohabitans maris TaxID=3071409 RepID=A0ABU0ZNG4_9ACTN|nr:ParA family protein [Phytohabitans sp. ZYX-F-186]MDQ7908576.1 ParA family protein [Phytohabitans sp. ZYX-F-186]
MKVISIINFKGGVGKTTLTANIGAGLAARGLRVLIIDLDPQASLTFSFFRPEEWYENLANKRTIKQWYDSAGQGRTPTSLASLVSTPPRVAHLISGSGGWLDIIASHLDLLSVDLLLASALDPRSGQVPPRRFVKVHQRLADGLAEGVGDYDIVLIDCAPNFNLVTKNAVVASDFMLIPTRPDFLSTRGIDHLGGQARSLVRRYNEHAAEGGDGIIKEPSFAVVFTMVTFRSDEPIEAHATYIAQTRGLGVPTFSTLVRDRKAVYSAIPESGVPVVLAGSAPRAARQETRQLVDEFRNWIEGNAL